jgi:threonine dehydratase
MNPAGPVRFSDIEAAALRLHGQVLDTPCVESKTLGQIVGARVFLKFENLQFTASFKERGALNKLAAAARGRPALRGVIAMRPATTRRAWPTTPRAWACAR